MERHELKARTDAQLQEWKNNLDIMKAKAEAATGDAKVGYMESVAKLQEQLDEFKIQAGKTWDSADDAWDSSSKDLELKWEEWELRAKKAWDELVR